MSLDQIIFVSRQSPDWGGLAQDYGAGLPIDPSRYEPRSKVPGFPDDIVACIQIWNDTFPMNFFRCRQALTNISQHSIRQISRAKIISDDRLSELPSIMKGLRVVLFFFDDDDLFAPNTFECLSTLDFGQCDVAVFPLVRFGEETFTFVRRAKTARIVVGRRRNFGHRFQTNNYGVCSGIALSEHLLQLKDHVLGSIHANQENLRDRYFDILISATNKSPCSANVIGGFLHSNQLQYRDFVRRYVENLGRVQIPPELGWMIEPLNETIELFREI
jgi:hypothetical protein